MANSFLRIKVNSLTRGSIAAASFNSRDDQNEVVVNEEGTVHRYASHADGGFENSYMYECQAIKYVFASQSCKSCSHESHNQDCHVVHSDLAKNWNESAHF